MIQVKIKTTAGEMIELGIWGDYCLDNGFDEWAVNEGIIDSDHEIELSLEEAKKYGLL